MYSLSVCSGSAYCGSSYQYHPTYMLSASPCELEGVRTVLTVLHLCNCGVYLYSVGWRVHTVLYCVLVQCGVESSHCAVLRVGAVWGEGFTMYCYDNPRNAN